MSETFLRAIEPSHWWFELRLRYTRQSKEDSLSLVVARDLNHENVSCYLGLSVALNTSDNEYSSPHFLALA